MALSRWNHSRWYIYEQDDGLVVMGDGYITLEELNSNFDKTLMKFRYQSSENSDLCEDNCSDLDFLELKIYVKAWQKLQNSKDVHEINEANEKINKLRKYGNRRFYLLFGSLEGFLNYWDKDISNKEKLIEVKDEKSKFLYTDDLSFLKVKILKFSKVEKFETIGVWDVKFEYKDSKNKIHIEQKKCFLSDFLSIENPLIVGENYLYNKDSGMFYNNEISGSSELKNQHLDSIISMLERSKVK